MQLATIILAAGEGTRFKSARPKILHALAGRPLVEYPLLTAHEMKSHKTVLVLSPGLKSHLKPSLNGQFAKTECAVQRKPLGTANAVGAAASKLKGFQGTVLILYGDVPLVRRETLQHFVNAVKNHPGPGGFLTVEQPDPTGYGRIVRGADSIIEKIVEDKDADANTREISEIWTGVLCCDAKWLFDSLGKVGRANAQKEFYLTALAGLAYDQEQGLLAVCADDPDEFIGVNSRAELAEVEMIYRHRLIESWMRRGVTFTDPLTTYIDANVTIGRDTIIAPNVSLTGTTVIGKNCHIGQGSVLVDTRVGDDVVVKPYSVTESARIGPRCQIGPFARLRPDTRLDADVRIGNFVETKNVWLKQGVKANHLTYLGDATIGAQSNVGCGTITCNYDGAHKHKTVIGEKVFIGSDVQFVAPVKVGKGATIAAGSVITDNVPPGALAVARGRQVNKKHWCRGTKR
jgi:bifunctional UDP-N-acetylglucosamine pyrophosphorylase / glucosamine-1-phosphate N-acetyltransferase